MGIFKSIKEDEVGEVCVTSRVETSVAIDSRVDSCRVQSSTTDSNGASALKAVLESYVQEIGEACMKELQGRVEGMLDRV